MILNDKDIEQTLFDAVAARIGLERFALWFGKGTRFLLRETTLHLVLPNRFLADFVRANFRKIIDETVLAVLKRPLPLVFSTTEEFASLKTAQALGGEEPSVGLALLPQPHFPAKACSKQALIQHETVIAITKGTPVIATLAQPTHSGLSHSSLTVPKQLGTVLPEAVSGLTRPTRSLPVEARPKPLSPGSVQPSLGGRPRPTRSPATTAPAPPKGAPYGPKEFASLKTFVEGASNNLARRAADFAIQYPGKINPIYIHGTTSVGKTHLLEGICRATRKAPGRKPPLYMTAEQFTNAFVGALRQGGMPAFRNKFRDISILLIDDIHFLEGKKQTQTELIHLIDKLKGEGIQLVFTGAKPIGRLSELRNEILARLEAGMVCEIKAPENTMLLEIFRRMVAQRRLPVPDEVCRFVATRLGGHARQLSGALNRLHALHLTAGGTITLAQAEESLEDLIQGNRRTVKMHDIEKAVCDTFGLDNQSLQGKSRARNVSQPRMLAMWLARKFTRSAMTEIGRFFGDRSHSCVVSAQKKVDHWLETDESIPCRDADCRVTEAIRSIERMLQSG